MLVIYAGLKFKNMHEYTKEFSIGKIISDLLKRSGKKESV
jgi:hypothetical protein